MKTRLNYLFYCVTPFLYIHLFLQDVLWRAQESNVYQNWSFLNFILMLAFFFFLKNFIGQTVSIQHTNR